VQHINKNPRAMVEKMVLAFILFFHLNKFHIFLNINSQQAVEKLFFLSLRAKRGNLAFNKINGLEIASSQKLLLAMTCGGFFNSLSRSDPKTLFYLLPWVQRRQNTSLYPLLLTEASGQTEKIVILSKVFVKGKRFI
jgi:hypothetical protein